MRQAIIIATLSLFTAAASAAAQTHPIMIRGTITAVKGDDLTIKTREGETADVKLAKGYRVSTVAKATLADIKPDSYIGTAAMPQPNGTLKAMEIHIFPASQRGTGEGSRPWDLAPHSTMTNAPVTGIVNSADGRVLTLTYKGGQKKVVVPVGIPIVMSEPATSADVKPGAGINVAGAVKTADGSYTTSRITVGKDGVNPPQ